MPRGRVARSRSPRPEKARRIAALPHDPGLDAILADPALSSTAKALVTVMVKDWAWRKDHCWPSDQTLAAKVGRSAGHVQRCLRELEQAGRIEREKIDAVPKRAPDLAALAVPRGARRRAAGSDTGGHRPRRAGAHRTGRSRERAN